MIFPMLYTILMVAWARAEVKPWVYCNYDGNDTKTIYDFVIPDITETKNISLKQYEGKQEPGADGEEILNGIQYVRPGKGFQPNFQLFKKIEVNGKNQHPLYTYLKERCPSPQEKFERKNKLFYDDLHAADIRWNFEKFLISTTGKPYMRFIPRLPPTFTVPFMEDLLVGLQQDSL